MTTMTVSRQRDYVPGDYTDLFENYYPFVIRLVSSSGIEQQHAEDVAMSILVKFFEKNALEQFDPEFATEHGGVRRRAVFSTFLSGFVYAYVRGYRDKLSLHKHREGMSIYEESTAGEEQSTWIDRFGPSFEEKYEGLALTDLVVRVCSHLSTYVPPPRTTMDLTALFMAVVEQVEADGRVDVPALGVRFGLSKNAIRSWLRRLRDEVATALDL